MKVSAIALLAALAASASAQYTLFAAETFAGSLGPNTHLYRGVDQYWLAGPGSAVLLGGLTPDQVTDPAGLRFVNGQLFVGNRHGNQAGQGSVSIFNFNGALSLDEVVTGNGLERVHGIDVSPKSGELFASQLINGVRRFLPAGGSYTGNGGLLNGDLRDVLVSADGTKIYQSMVTGSIITTDLSTNTSTSFNVAPGRALHQMALRDGKLYVTSLVGSNPNGTGSVHEITLDASLEPVSTTVAVDVDSAIGVAFSPDGSEMLVSQHTLDAIQRFAWNGASWTFDSEIAADTNVGYLATTAVPEPGLLVLAAVAALFLRRRKASA
jgi:MYXO-CTERM domain-containing protein